ncbi:uncharacterized protein LOC116428573 [Nomia melanderi]|uniref:uncharacterized protein LOC116428573 n=1 Tax=Nomia melanderi TaxID=2448451 RepID=UPI0013046FB2|nr:peptidyl-prolyl cis-trans isomerase 1-like [Nomia melanderi]
MSAKKSQKIEAQVVEAIRRLQAVQGSTPREISSYISQEYDLPSSEIKRQVQIALKRGVSYGILQKLKGGCYTYNLDFLERHPVAMADTGVEMPSRHRRSRRGRRRSRRRGRSGKRRRSRRSRRRSGRRRSRRSRGRRRRRRSDVPQDIDALDVNILAKQPKRSTSLLRKESPQSEGSSISGASEGKQGE